jgi:hypothetical protein
MPLVGLRPRRMGLPLVAALALGTLGLQHAKLLSSLGDEVWAKARSGAGGSYSWSRALMQFRGNGAGGGRGIRVEPFATASFRAAAGLVDCERFGAADGAFLCISSAPGGAAPTWDSVHEICDGTVPEALDDSVFILPAHHWAGLRVAAHAALLAVPPSPAAGAAGGAAPPPPPPPLASSTFPVNFTVDPWDALPALGGPRLGGDWDHGSPMTLGGAMAQAAAQARVLSAHRLLLTHAHLFDGRFDALLNGTEVCDVAGDILAAVAATDAASKRVSDGRGASRGGGKSGGKGRKGGKHGRHHSKHRRKGVGGKLSAAAAAAQAAADAAAAAAAAAGGSEALLDAERARELREMLLPEWACVIGLAGSRVTADDGSSSDSSDTSNRVTGDNSISNATTPSAFWGEVVAFAEGLMSNISARASSSSQNEAAIFAGGATGDSTGGSTTNVIQSEGTRPEAGVAGAPRSLSSLSQSALFELLPPPASPPSLSSRHPLAVSTPLWCDSMDAIVQAVAAAAHTKAHGAIEVYDDFGIGLTVDSARDAPAGGSSSSDGAGGGGPHDAAGADAAARLQALLSRACDRAWLPVPAVRAALAGVQRRMFTTDAEMRLHDQRQMVRAAGRESSTAVFPPNSTILRGLEKGNRALIQSGFNPPGSHSLVGSYLTAFNVIVTETGGLQTLPGAPEPAAAGADGGGVGPVFTYTGRNTCEGEQRDPLSPKQLKAALAPLPVVDEVVVLTHRYEWNIYHWTAEAVAKVAPMLDYLRAHPHVRIHVQTTSGQPAPFREAHLGLLGLDWKARTVRGYVRARVVHYVDNHMCGYPYALWTLLLRERYRAALGLPTPPSPSLVGLRTGAFRPSPRPMRNLPAHLAGLDLAALPRDDPRAVALRKRLAGSYVPSMPTHRRRVVVLRRRRTRKITNEGRLLRRLGRLANVSVVEVRDWDMPDPVATFRLLATADIVIAAHGAGLANTIVTAPGACVVEFMPVSGCAGVRKKGEFGGRGRVASVGLCDENTPALLIDSPLLAPTTFSHSLCCSTTGSCRATGA